MDSQLTDVKKSRSSYVNRCPKTIPSREEHKSNVDIVCDNKSMTSNQYEDCHKYYKKFSHDELPVKEDSSYDCHTFCDDPDHDSGQGDNKDSIANDFFDEIEMKILKKMSQELQTDENSISCLDSNIKLFKTTVNQIFDNFYANMQDFETYKKKFYDILQKNKGDSVAEMEDFIKDMIQHIGSSESSASDGKPMLKDLDQNTNKNNSVKNIDLKEERLLRSFNSTIEEFKNDNYMTDSTFEHNSSKFNTSEKKAEFLNIFLQSGTRYVEIKMNDRSLFSEINIRDELCDGIKEPLASAENIKKLKEKKFELENYAKEQGRYVKYREIPVKNSNAKNNIHLHEGCTGSDKDESQKFFIFRICNYICRKIRKNSLV